MNRILQSHKTQIMARMKPAESMRTTPFLETERSFPDASEMRQPTNVHSNDSESAKPSQKVTPMISISTEVAMFATTQTTGILDLGFSQTIMGQHQVPEFLESFPEDVRMLVQERPASMSFRFGNNSVVPCHKAIFVPVDRFWIIIAIVESKTPFLISNSVCRSLGAVIDTTRRSILFKALGCELPLKLSSKKLFLLDFCALTACCPPRPPTGNQSGKHQMIAAETVLSSLSEGQDMSPNSSQAGSNSLEMQTPSEPTQSVKSESVVDSTETMFEIPEDPRSPKRCIPECPGSKIVKEPTCSTSSDPIVSESHGFTRSRVSFRHSPCPEDPGKPGSGAPANVLRGLGPTADPVWRSQEGEEIWRSCPEGPSLLPLVSEKVDQQPEGRTSHVLPLPEHVDRKEVAVAEHRNHPWRHCGSRTNQFLCVPQGQGQERWEAFQTNATNRSGLGRRGVLGSFVPRSQVRQGRRDVQEVWSSGRSFLSEVLDQLKMLLSQHFSVNPANN